MITSLKKFPKDKIHITSHADDRVSHKHNHRLSQLGGDGIVNYLISKGLLQIKKMAQATWLYMLSSNLFSALLILPI